MKDKLQQLLSSDTETEVLEFKEASTQINKHELGKYFSALSNEANLKGCPCAWLLLGVKNDKSICGTNISDKQLNEYKHEIARHTSPTMNFINTYRLSTKNGNVLMLEIPSAPKGMPVYWKTHPYGRDGESLGGLNSEEYDRIRKQNILDDWSAQIVDEANIEDLSEEAITKARESYLVKNPKLKNEIIKWSDATFLNKSKITIKGKITNTAILLLGKSESEHFLNSAVAKMSWILRDRDNISKDYEHFSCPFILTAPLLRNKIRNLKYRYIHNGSLFPDEVDSYDPYIIREALNNCIAHQDYTLGGKINVVEREDSTLIFLNKGTFIPQSIENVLTADAPESIYRNRFLAEAMVNLNMIDTIGSGIVKMFNVQRHKYFPLPEYSFDNNSVQVIIEGKIIDINYASKLATIPDLTLSEIILLDKVQKGIPLMVEEANKLKIRKLVEGKRPNLHISSNVAKYTNQKDDYIKLKGINDGYAKKMMLDYLKEFEPAKKNDFVKALLDKLPDILTESQKKNKIKNYLQDLRKEGKIINLGKSWEMAKDEPF